MKKPRSTTITFKVRTEDYATIALAAKSLSATVPEFVLGVTLVTIDTWKKKAAKKSKAK